MALFGLFTTQKPTQKAIEKQLIKIKEPYSQSEYRKIAMEKLLKWNTKESIESVLKRFEVVVQSLYWDENEKKWLLEELIKKGTIVKNALTSFLKISNDVTYAIEALNKLCVDKLEFTELLLNALTKRLPEDHRLIQGKKEIIIALGQYNIPSNLKILTPYLNDHSDDIQCTVVDIFCEKQFSQNYCTLLEMISQNNRSARVLHHTAKAIIKLKISTNKNIVLAVKLTKDYSINKNRLQFHKF